MSAHTPGPWDLTPGPHGDPDFDDCDFIIGESRAAGDAVATVVGPVRTGTAEGNARLIAAAPELLSVIKKLRRVVDASGLDPVDADYCSILEQADIAIAKAEGE